MNLIQFRLGLTLAPSELNLYRVLGWGFLFKIMNDTKDDYFSFLAKKKHSIGSMGFEPLYFPDIAFDFQREIISRATRKGRMAVFADTGMGKTLIQLSLAMNVIMKTNRKVLILTPLAVAFQFIKEAEKLGIDDIEYSKDGKHKSKIVVCNYERLHYFDSSDFEAVILDESSILKNFDGKIKNHITAFIKKVNYRYLSTATPSPNDFIELGTSSEALGYMGYTDMLGRFFKNAANSIDPKHAGEKWYLKPHAERNFFSWVNQWSVMVKMPSDIGFSDDRYVLPDLVTNTHVVDNNKSLIIDDQFEMFNVQAKGFNEVRQEVKQTIQERCEKAVELAKDKNSVYWCNRNEESDLLNTLDGESVEIRGSQSIDKKEEILIAFAEGEIKRLITKASMTSFGLNWQHCNHTVYFPTYSYEQYYQAIRRFWRFGQERPVTVDLVISDGQKLVMESLEKKTQKARQLYENLTENVNSVYTEKKQKETNNLKLPTFI